MLRRLMIALLIAFLAVPIALAQDGDPPPEDAPPTIDLSALAERVESALTAVESALEDVEELEERTNDLLGLAVDMFGLFEGLSAVFGVALPIIVAIAGFFGFRRLERASEELREARERFETEMDAKRTELDRMRGQLEETVEHQRRSSTQASIALGLLVVGQTQYRAKDNSGSIDTFDRALRYDEENPIIWYNRGYVLTQSSEFEEALESLQKALQLDETFIPARAALGYVHRRMGDQVNKDIDSLLKDGIHPQADAVAALRLRRDKLYVESERYFTEALENLPKLVDEDGESWWGALGGLYRRRGQVDQAIYAYEQGAKVTPKSSYPFSNLAMLYAERGQLDEMEARFIRVERLALAEVQADADNNWAYNDLITSRLALGKDDIAFDALEEALQIATKDSPYALQSLRETLDRLMQYMPEARHQSIARAIRRVREFEAEREARNRRLNE